MAFFGVTIEEINSISPIPDAERILKATLKGLSFEFVIPKDKHFVGEKVLYIPIDSIVPITLQEKAGLIGKLSGKFKNRVKTIKMRGQYSQGIVLPLSVLDEYQGERTSEKITEFLGVMKYEFNEDGTSPAYFISPSAHFSGYDIECADRYPSVLEILKPQLVYISEKLEGMNFSILYDGEKLWINQRNLSIDENIHKKIMGAPHPWWEIARKLKLDEFVKRLYSFYHLPITAYGEMIGPGIQKNHYQLKEKTVRLFDIRVGFTYLNPLAFLEECETHRIETVPTVSFTSLIALNDFMQGRSLAECASGDSALCPGRLREGIVIKPSIEQSHPLLGRLFLKQRDPIYDEKYN